MLFVCIMLVYLYNACLFVFYFALDFCIDICTNALSLGYSHKVCLFCLLFSIMYSAFNQLVLFILCSHCFCL